MFPFICFLVFQKCCSVLASSFPKPYGYTLDWTPSEPAAAKRDHGSEGRNQLRSAMARTKPMGKRKVTFAPSPLQPLSSPGDFYQGLNGPPPTAPARSSSLWRAAFTPWSPKKLPRNPLGWTLKWTSKSFTKRDHIQLRSAHTKPVARHHDGHGVFAPGSTFVQVQAGYPHRHKTAWDVKPAKNLSARGQQIVGWNGVDGRRSTAAARSSSQTKPAAEPAARREVNLSVNLSGGEQIVGLKGLNGCRSTDFARSSSPQTHKSAGIKSSSDDNSVLGYLLRQNNDMSEGPKLSPLDLSRRDRRPRAHQAWWLDNSGNAVRRTVAKPWERNRAGDGFAYPEFDACDMSQNGYTHQKIPAQVFQVPNVSHTASFFSVPTPEISNHEEESHTCRFEKSHVCR